MSDSKADQSQVDKFRDLARDLEADEDEAHFEEPIVSRGVRPGFDGT